eukprot:4459293-Amphidinium_carterae.1
MLAVLTVSLALVEPWCYVGLQGLGTLHGLQLRHHPLPTDVNEDVWYVWVNNAFDTLPRREETNYMHQANTTAF